MQSGSQQWRKRSARVAKVGPWPAKRVRLVRLWDQHDLAAFHSLPPPPQLLAFVGMEKPVSLHPDDIRDQKVGRQS